MGSSWGDCSKHRCTRAPVFLLIGLSSEWSMKRAALHETMPSPKCSDSSPDNWHWTSASFRAR